MKKFQKMVAVGLVVLLGIGMLPAITTRRLKWIFLNNYRYVSCSHCQKKF